MGTCTTGPTGAFPYSVGIGLGPGNQGVLRIGNRKMWPLMQRVDDVCQDGPGRASAPCDSGKRTRGSVYLQRNPSVCERQQRGNSWFLEVRTIRLLRSGLQSGVCVLSGLSHLRYVVSYFSFARQLTRHVDRPQHQQGLLYRSPCSVRLPAQGRLQGPGRL